MPLKAVLFDMDGVIVDTEPLHRKAYYKTFETLGIDVSNDLYSSFTGNSTKKVCQVLIDQFSLKETEDQISKMKRLFFKDFFDNDPDFGLISGVRELIEHYYQHDIRLILASSASMNTINWVFEKFDLNPYFSGKVSGADLKESKPNPEIFLLAAKKANVTEAQCMVIEDSTNGILAANRAGIFCAGFKSPHSTLQNYDLADVVVHDFAELEIEKIKHYF